MLYIGSDMKPCPSVSPGRPGPGVGVKKKGPLIQPTSKTETTGATLARAILDSPDRAEPKLALASVAPAGTGYKLAVTSQLLVPARSTRGIRARGIFPGGRAPGGPIRIHAVDQNRTPPRMHRGCTDPLLKT